MIFKSRIPAYDYQRIILSIGVHESCNVTLAGQHFAPITGLGVNPWIIQNNREMFGLDASEFKPEQWLTDDAEKRAAMDRNFLAFGAAPRMCIGKNISLLEMYKVIPKRL
jgi:cytochrome P450